VQVFAAEDEERVVITVSDEGLGIPMSDLPHVFQRYYRGSNVQGFGGTGIGLYLVQTVATLHGGNVSVESREGRGSRFIFSLPLKAELVAATAL
jgi:signal transduction histidine kinase